MSPGAMLTEISFAKEKVPEVQEGSRLGRCPTLCMQQLRKYHKKKCSLLKWYLLSFNFVATKV